MAPQLFWGYAKGTENEERNDTNISEGWLVQNGALEEYFVSGKSGFYSLVTYPCGWYTKSISVIRGTIGRFRQTNTYKSWGRGY